MLCRKGGRESRKIMFISHLISTPNLFYNVIFFNCWRYFDLNLDVYTVDTYYIANP